jgi:hypothetical protein
MTCDFCQADAPVGYELLGDVSPDATDRARLQHTACLSCVPVAMADTVGMAAFRLLVVRRVEPPSPPGAPVTSVFRFVLGFFRK